MGNRAEVGGGFTVLDGAALVTGAAVASVHVKAAVPDFDDLMDWVWAAALFTWLATTAAGPFLYLVRRFATRPAGYPRLGDRLWALTGLPWAFSALVRTGQPSQEVTSGRLDPAYAVCLGVGLALVAVLVIAVLLHRYLLANPEKVVLVEPTPWTHRLGLLLSVAWPVQCLVGHIVTS